MADRPARLPPLTALRAFEAAARHMSFAKAADELAVTPAALSFQIKSLEEHLGVKLFRRLNRAVALTAAGAALTPGLSEGFEAFRRALRSLDRMRQDRPLAITAGPAFTGKWLAPRIFHFISGHPDIEIRLVASLKVMDFEADEVDAAIRFTLGAPAGCYSEVLITDRMTPMCTPDIAVRLRAPEDMLTAPLIHDDSLTPLPASPTWADWFEAAGLARADWRRGPRFSAAEHAYAAAAEGAGVVLGRISLTGDLLASGRLVAPFDLAIDPVAHFRFVCPEGAEARPDIVAFLAWLRGEVAGALDPGSNLRVVTPTRLLEAAQANPKKPA